MYTFDMSQVLYYSHKSSISKSLCTVNVIYQIKWKTSKRKAL